MEENEEIKGEQMTEAIRSFAKAQAESSVPSWMHGMKDVTNPSYLAGIKMLGLGRSLGAYMVGGGAGGMGVGVGAAMAQGIESKISNAIGVGLRDRVRSAGIGSMIREICNPHDAEPPQQPIRAVRDMTSDELHALIVSAVKQGAQEAREMEQNVAESRYKSAFS